jgi:hypothetical protein
MALFTTELFESLISLSELCGLGVDSIPFRNALRGPKVVDTVCPSLLYRDYKRFICE